MIVNFGKAPVLLLAASLAVTLPTSVCAEPTKENANDQASATFQPNESTQRLIQAYDRLLRQHTRQNMGITRSVRILIKNYPEHVEPILAAAFLQRPNAYHHIARAAIHAEPALTQDIVSLAIRMELAAPEEVVQVAIRAEPTYIDDIVHAASIESPNDLESIVRVAVKTDPEMASTILSSVNNNEVGHFSGFIQTTLNALPALGNYLVDTFHSIIPGEDKLTPEQQLVLSEERTDKILRGALQAGISRDEVEEAAHSAGISTHRLDEIQADLQALPN